MKTGIACICAVGMALCAVWFFGAGSAAPKAPPGVAGGIARGPLKGTPGVTYSREPTLRHKLPHAGPGTTYTIYTYTGTNEAIYFHGFNKYRHALLHASGTKLARDFFGRTLERLDPEVTFETVYPANSKKVGRWGGADSIVPVISHQRFAKRGYSAAPPQLPKDGETVKVNRVDYPSGPAKDALWLGFGPDHDSAYFLIIGHPKNIETGEPAAQELKYGRTRFAGGLRCVSWQLY